MNQIALQALQAFGVTLNHHQIEAFRLYATELTAWNEHTNLTAITDPERARRPVRPEGKIAVVAEKGALPGGPAACAGSPLGGGQLAEPKVGMGL